MRRILSSIGFTVALLCPWIAYRAESADQLHHDVAEPLGSRSAQHLLLLVSVPAGRREPGELQFAGAYLEAVRYRPIDNTFSFITNAASNDAFYSDSQFIGYGFGNQTTRHRDPGAAGLRRQPGVEAGLLARRSHHSSQWHAACRAMVADGTIGGAFGRGRHRRRTTIEWETPGGERRTARMVKRLVTIPTVSLTRVSSRWPQGRLPVLPQLRAAVDRGA